jgi:hypothetical protein
MLKGSGVYVLQRLDSEPFLKLSYSILFPNHPIIFKNEEQDPASHSC